MMDLINELPRDEQDIIFRMSRGCVKKTMHIRDPLQYAYIFNVCAKENDNEVSVNIQFIFLILTDFSFVVYLTLIILLLTIVNFMIKLIISLTIFFLQHYYIFY